MYAAGYNTNDTYLVDVPVVWESISILDPVNGTGTSFTFSPVTPLTSGTIIAISGFITDATGVIIVTSPLDIESSENSIPINKMANLLFEQ